MENTLPNDLSFSRSTNIEGGTKRCRAQSASKAQERHCTTCGHQMYICIGLEASSWDSEQVCGGSLTITGGTPSAADALAACSCGGDVLFKSARPTGGVSNDEGFCMPIAALRLW